MPKKNTIEVLERRKTMIDALITFIKKHPKSADDAHAKGLDSGKNGLSFPDYALIVPYWNNGDIQLRLLKSGEDWMNLNSDVERLVSDDVSEVPDKKLEEMLDRMYREANPDEEDAEEEDE
ncbi:MAG: hypothetical protein ACLPND_17705 [Candidatus Korobacteraceae bacterium]